VTKLNSSTVQRIASHAALQQLTSFEVFVNPIANTMDSPIVAQLFRQLFRHRPCGCRGHNAPLRSSFRSSLRQSSRQAIRAYASKPSIDRGMKTNESRWQQRSNILPEDRRKEFAEYPYISIQELKMRTERPRRVKMLLRDFIEGTSRSAPYLASSLETETQSY
jgi:hypothetical protein